MCYFEDSHVSKISDIFGEFKNTVVEISMKDVKNPGEIVKKITNSIGLYDEIRIISFNEIKI